MMIGMGFMLFIGLLILLLVIGLPILLLIFLAGRDGGFLRRQNQPTVAVQNPPPPYNSPAQPVQSGITLSRNCVHCGSDLQSNWTHCPHCGAPIN